MFRGVRNKGDALLSLYFQCLMACRRGSPPDALHGPPDVFRRCSAAAANGLHAHGGDFFHPLSKGLRIHVVDRFSVFCTRKTCVGIDQDGNGSSLGHPLYDRDHLLGSHAAVDAETVDPQSLQHRYGGIHGASGQELPGAVVNVGDQDRKITVFLCRQYCRLGLIAVAHGLNEDQVSSGCRSDADDLAKEVYSLFKGKVSERLQQTPRRTDVQRNIGIPAAGAAAGFLCQGYSGFHDLAEILRVFQRIRAESVCVENITSGVQVAAVQIDDILRARQVPLFGQFPAFQSFFLQDRTCPAVKKEPLPAEPFQQGPPAGRIRQDGFFFFCAHKCSIWHS